MTQEELQDLSRRAAKLLPKDWLRGVDLPFFVCYEQGNFALVNGYVSDHCRSPRKWLHESTEACAEIMVRVLWPKGIVVDDGTASKRNRHGDCELHVFDHTEKDPMQAFRTAVLLALCEVMG